MIWNWSSFLHKQVAWVSLSFPTLVSYYLGLGNAKTACPSKTYVCKLILCLVKIRHIIGLGVNSRKEKYVPSSLRFSHFSHFAPASIISVRLPLQSATPPHWANSPMAVRSILASARRRTALRFPNRIQIMFWSAATFIQLLAWVDIKMHKAVEAW
jgi:hypothetical protein